MTLYTLVYFAPSACGDDYTDGFIDSSSELEISVFATWQEAAIWMASTNAKIYNDGTLNRKSYSYINAPEYEFRLLVDGKSTFIEHNDEVSGTWDWDYLQDTEVGFMELYTQHYRELREMYKQGKAKKVAEKSAEVQRAIVNAELEQLAKLKEKYEQ